MVGEVKYIKLPKTRFFLFHSVKYNVPILYSKKKAGFLLIISSFPKDVTSHKVIMYLNKCNKLASASVCKVGIVVNLVKH